MNAEVPSRTMASNRFPAGVPIVQCAANFSEGRRNEVIESIVRAAASESGAVVADYSADPDHNRMVLSLLGTPDAVRHAVMRAATEAVRLVDLRSHSGAHPRMGVVDVVPFTPIRGVDIAECAALAEVTAETMASELGIPVYLYEHAARPGRPVSLPAIRKAVGASGSAEPRFDLLAPDYPAPFDPAKGAAVVGARGPLVAYNVYLRKGGLEHARKVARIIRDQRGRNRAIAGVRSLGLYLPAHGLAQVSMNVTRPADTPLPRVFEFVAHAVRDVGGEVGEGEVIGLVPMVALSGARPGDTGFEIMKPSQIIEYWLADEPPS